MEKIDVFAVAEEGGKKVEVRAELENAWGNIIEVRPGVKDVEGGKKVGVRAESENVGENIVGVRPGVEDAEGEVSGDVKDPESAGSDGIMGPMARLFGVKVSIIHGPWPPRKRWSARKC